MTPTETDRLIRQLIGGDPHAPVAILQRAANSTDPVLLVAAALINSAGPDRLSRAAQLAGNTRDRQLVAIAAAYVARRPGPGRRARSRPSRRPPRQPARRLDRERSRTSR